MDDGEEVDREYDDEADKYETFTQLDDEVSEGSERYNVTQHDFKFPDLRDRVFEGETNDRSLDSFSTYVRQQLQKHPELLDRFDSLDRGLSVPETYVAMRELLYLADDADNTNDQDMMVSDDISISFMRQWISVMDETSVRTNTDEATLLRRVEIMAKRMILSGETPLRIRRRVSSFIMQGVVNGKTAPQIEREWQHTEMLRSTTVRQWARRLLNQRAVAGALRTRGVDMSSGLDGRSILGRAKAVRLILQDPREVLAHVSGRSYEWPSDPTALRKYLRGWALAGTDVFESIVLYLERGGPEQPLKLQSVDVHAIIQWLQNNPSGSVVDAIDERLPGADGKVLHQIYRGLKRFGINRKTPRGMQANALRLFAMMDVKRFRERFQDIHVVGQTADVVWMDETTVSTEVARQKVWSYQGTRPVVLEAKRAGLGGAYNMMCSIGVIGGKSFIHYMIYKPQRAQLRESTPRMFSEHGKYCKVMGNYVTIANYMFGTWNHMNLDGYRYEFQRVRNDCLFDAIARIYNSGVSNDRPLYLLWDAFSGHFAQKVYLPRSGNAREHKARFNPAFDAFRYMARGLLLRHGVDMPANRIHMVHMPRYNPQFSLCERVFAHMKNYISRNARLRRSDKLSETELMLLIKEFVQNRKPSYALLLARACKYRVNDQATEDPVEVTADVCRCILDIQRPLPTMRDKQLVCVTRDSARPVAVLGPSERNSWRILDLNQAMFDPDLDLLHMESFGYFKSQTDDDLRSHFYVYSGFDLVDYTSIRVAEQIAHSRVAAEILDYLVMGGAAQRRVICDQGHAWQMFIQSAGNREWLFYPKVIGESGIYAAKNTTNGAVLIFTPANKSLMSGMHGILGRLEAETEIVRLRAFFPQSIVLDIITSLLVRRKLPSTTKCDYYPPVRDPDAISIGRANVTVIHSIRQARLPNARQARYNLRSRD
jgi:hypothetical protein